MKQIFTLCLLTFISACGSTHQSTSNLTIEDSKTINLDGKEFCRTIVSDGLFGQPAGEREHCVSFRNGKMTDNANTFFGNPPETLSYRLSGVRVEVRRNGAWKVEYKLKDKTLRNEAGAVLRLKLNLDGKEYCRTVVSDGLFGQPAGERLHCVSFEAGKMTDDANTFFGNPPETLTYRVSRGNVEVLREGVWNFAYKIKGKTLENGAGAVLKQQ